jgi:NAD(P) transhydrogenase
MTQSVRHYDTIVIGSGPAGEGAAMTLAKAGKKVAVIERHSDVGGGCTHWGTIPSKALRHSAQLLMNVRSRPAFHRAGFFDLTYQELLASASSVVESQASMRRRFHHRNGVDLMEGAAHFVDAHTIEVESSRGGTMRCDADYIIIATGSTPYRPPDIDFTHPRVRDSDSVLSPDVPEPRSVTIYGAGVIGCEYASFFGALGLKVNLVNTFDRLLAFLDSEITDALGYHLREMGITIRNNEEYESVEVADSHVVMHCKSGKHFRTDLVLWANGRSGNTASLGLKEIGVDTNHRNQLEVNKHLQTTVEHIYGAGDVIGPPGLASASYDQGRFVGQEILAGGSAPRLIRDVPTGIYTSPEISSLGPTEKELTDAKVPYEVGRALFRSIARAQITGETVGMLKILFHTETKEILGLHCFGGQAAEIIHIGQAIMAQPAPHNTIQYFVDTTFNYPTMAEAYRVAALNGLNRL